MLELNQFSKLDRRHQLFFEIIAVILILVFCERVLLSRVKDKFDDLKSDIKLEEARLLNNSKINNDIVTLKKRYDKTSDYVVKNSANETELKARMLEELEKIAKLSRVTIVSIDSSEEKTQVEQWLDMYTADIRIEGAYSNCLSFLKYISKSSSLFDFEEFVVRAQSDDGKIIRLDSVIKYYVFT